MSASIEQIWNILASRPKFDLTPTFIFCSAISPNYCGVVLFRKCTLVFEKLIFSFDQSNMQIFTVNNTRVVWPQVELWWLLLLADIFRRQNVKSRANVAVSLSHDEKMKKRRGPALKFRHAKIQSKNQLNQYCLLLQPLPTPPCVVIVRLSPLPG